MPFPDTHPALTRALKARGYDQPTPVQEAVLELGLDARDLLVSAQTGSGKTVAFGLAFASTLLGEKEKLPPTRSPLALVIAPTRELALQVQSELTWLYGETGARIASCIGGTDARREARALERGVHIVVGTPGRLCDHLSRGKLDLSALRVVVLDEADEMLDMGFREELEQILDAAPPERRTLLFSATLAREIVGLARRYQKDAARIDTISGQKQHADITYRGVVTAPQEIGRSLVNVLRYYDSPTTLVFCNTRLLVGQVQAELLQRGFASVAISGEMGQNERSRAIESLKSGLARVCVATDVAARGIDIPALGLVVHASLPSSSETLLHRSGRTGRAGRKGTSVLMVPFNQRRRAERLLAQAKIKATWENVPSVDAVAEQDARRLMEDPLLTQEPQGESDPWVAKLVETFDATRLATALVGMYKSRLPRVEKVRPVSLEPPKGRDARSGGRVESGAWFRLGVGRSEKADPKWLVPLICRLGGVQKRDIGSIRIQQEDTLFQISDEKVARFNACRAGVEDGEASIEPAEAPPAGPPRRGGRGSFGGGGRRPGGPGGGRFGGRRDGGGGRGRGGPGKRPSGPRSGEKSTRRRS
ncbi:MULTISPECIES: DEAD/DEAH box helicase [unclassified Saccharibacter]|uniref:DEAD/DEAH box helicase n=1 Tax=unclassified Saccharibacter TaxID=2648722 RepID=UPI0013210664|nr:MULTISPECIES: DEAD/DEAH box helicase [unclassified Saccharibacter]MXV36590.1 DEAD/DEAH box helicase [Saccharibacter sp. EH611]MXV57752.1 DEAD/DEAH box helicase [Saccharibacter sp. EH70]MXV64941.1 DEAD/DEAH box helicase [Saccharibacter sp. EH60]